jgi:hypothetical protein
MKIKSYCTDTDRQRRFWFCCPGRRGGSFLCSFVFEKEHASPNPNYILENCKIRIHYLASGWIELNIHKRRTTHWDNLAESEWSRQIIIVYQPPWSLQFSKKKHGCYSFPLSPLRYKSRLVYLSHLESRGVDSAV